MTREHHHWRVSKALAFGQPFTLKRMIASRRIPIRPESSFMRFLSEKGYPFCQSICDITIVLLFSLLFHSSHRRMRNFYQSFPVMYIEFSQILFFVVIQNDFLWESMFSMHRRENFTAKIGIDFFGIKRYLVSLLWNLLN